MIRTIKTEWILTIVDCFILSFFRCFLMQSNTLALKYSYNQLAVLEVLFADWYETAWLLGAI